MKVREKNNENEGKFICVVASDDPLRLPSWVIEVINWLSHITESPLRKGNIRSRTLLRDAMFVDSLVGSLRPHASPRYGT